MIPNQEIQSLAEEYGQRTVHKLVWDMLREGMDIKGPFPITFQEFLGVRMQPEFETGKLPWAQDSFIDCAAIAFGAASKRWVEMAILLDGGHRLEPDKKN